jgi:hypothetical protein
MDNITLMDVRIVFRNFSGKESQFNRAGSRNFCVLLDEDTANHMVENGWHVKSLASREEGEEDQPYIKVSVGYKVRPPKIVLISSKGRADIPESLVEMLDWIDVKTADLIITPYAWELKSGASGVSAYLKTLYITIEESALDLKYADVEYATQMPLAIESGPDYLEGEVIE